MADRRPELRPRLRDFVRGHPRVRFISFFNGAANGQFDLGRKPKSLAAYKRYIVPLTR